MKKLLLFLTIALLTGCKEKNSLAPENDIVGKWRLISYCQASGGLISGCFQVTIPTDKAVYVEFSSKGAFNETYKNTIPADYAFLGCGMGSYEIEEGKVRIRAMCMSSLAGKLVEINTLTSKKLILQPFPKTEYIFEKQ